MTNSRPLLSWRHAAHGGVVYSTGDSIAALISGEFQFDRFLGVLLVGSTLYAVEIPAYFNWIERRFNRSGRWNSFIRALSAQAYFNPLWIARHLAFIRMFSGRWSEIGWGLLAIGLDSFLHALPFALLINYGIQNAIPLQWRFFASSVFSSGMAVYYALSEVLFG